MSLFTIIQKLSENLEILNARMNIEHQKNLRMNLDQLSGNGQLLVNDQFSININIGQRSTTNGSVWLG